MCIWQWINAYDNEWTEYWLALVETTRRYQATRRYQVRCSHYRLVILCKRQMGRVATEKSVNRSRERGEYLCGVESIILSVLQTTCYMLQYYSTTTTTQLLTYLPTCLLRECLGMSATVAAGWMSPTLSRHLLLYPISLRRAVVLERRKKP